ncbi:mannose-1-phosphate guanylyltransferase [Odoribacter laneus]|uniref:mannose-1-phosphate guanylyltransferase n=1 Tax=Odoribacter laneus TaxID=626933 RepID=UPI00033ADC2E|nr:mannose-1-phosphate guanylyltransferase [Odoribacter laneus]CCZ81432.1 mannose-1-phosphate guanylyltransferase/mannose-6-phosphate isomerase [Odoribacter laneus CAG:561]
MSNNHLVIMAGGVGSRFWPMSTPEKPKQFIDVLGTGRTLLQLTADRFTGICPPENVWVVTAEKYRDIVKEQLPEVSDDHILLEPCMRNTAPCIAYVSWKIKKRYPEANLVVSASDHIVTDVEEFVRVIRKGLEFTGSEDRILTLGMKPTRPETGYGYIKMEREALGEGEIRKVEGFKEKPDRMTAEKYLREGGYTWNSGIFLWSVSTVEKAFRSYQPKMSALFDSLEDYFYTEKEREIIGQKFPDCEKISVDYAIMEHAQNIYVFPADFGWSDLGTWGSLYELSGKDKEGNAIIGERVKMVECRDCIVHLSGEHQIVLQGLEGYIVAEQNGVILICRKEEEQRIKEFSYGNKQS